MSQRPDGKVVHAGLGDRAGAGQRQPAAGLQQRPAAGQPHCRGQVRYGEVVQQDQVGAGLQRLGYLLEGVALDLQRQARARAHRTAANAAATDPAAATWLSLIRAASDSDIRWLTPPPQRTAYFSSARRPGVVLRVSLIARRVPATASAHCRVRVATPDRWHSRFSAVRSAVRIGRDRAGHGEQRLRRRRPGRRRPSAACT